MNIPCIKKKGLNIFSTTADERLLLGKEIFLNTHYPVKFRRYRGENLTETWTENKVLELIKNNEQDAQGNRVFVLFGAAGSGKSESIRWIETKLSNYEVDRTIIRISRTELDPLIILNKVLTLVGKEVSKDTIIKWEILKNKPVTLANSIVWDSLNLLLETDKDIIPISYKLRPLIENNLRRSFSDLDQTKQLKEKIVELITIEELEDVIQSCAIPITINYEQLRKHLIEKLEAEILGGYSFVDTLREVGNQLFLKTGNRPILLIDDFVQSMNIYSSDLLDFFITFEEGNWDIVIGLTPASFESTKRGRELLTRINNLDTFDDRLYKLWLTDECGNESYTIDDENASDYIRNYLDEYKRINGFTCDKSCFNFSKCSSIHWGNSDDIALTPLNKHLANRIFNNLFKNKGQARQYVVTVGEYLNSIINSNPIEFLSTRIIRECSVDIEEYNKKIYIESFIPVDSTEVIDIPSNFFKLCGFKKINGNLRVELINLRIKSKDNSINNQLNEYVDKPEVSVLRDWLEGKEVNKELFRSFRGSCTTFLKEFSKKPDLIRQYTSRNLGTIRKEKTIEGCKLPISIQDVDHFVGISVSKELGYNVFKLMQIKESNKSNQLELLNELLYEKQVTKMINQTNRVGEDFLREFENEIGISCSELSFLLYIFAYLRTEIKDMPIIIKKQYKRLSLQVLPAKWYDNFEEISDIEFKFIIDFFNNWFQLRENFYDGFELKKLILKYDRIMNVLEGISKIKIKNLSKDFVYYNNTVYELLDSILSKSLKCYNVLTDKTLKDYCNEIMNNINNLTDLTIDNLYKIQSNIYVIKNKYTSMNDLLNVQKEPFNEKEFNKFNNLIKELKTDYPEYCSDLTNVIKTEIYCYFDELNDIYLKLINKYSDLYKSFTSNLKRFTLVSDNYLNQLDFQIEKKEIEDINKIPYLIENTILRIKNIQDKIDYVEYIRKYVGVEFVNKLENNNRFISSLKINLTNDEFSRLEINDCSSTIDQFLEQTQNILYSNEVVKIDKELNSKIMQLVINKSLDQIYKRVFDYLVNSVDAHIILSKINNDKEEYNRYFILGELLQNSNKKYNNGVTDEVNYVLTNISEKRIDKEQVYRVLNLNGFSVNSSEILSELIVEGQYESNLSSLKVSVIEELDSLMPDLLTKVKCTLSYN